MWSRPLCGWKHGGLGSRWVGTSCAQPHPCNRHSPHLRGALAWVPLLLSGGHVRVPVPLFPVAAFALRPEAPGSGAANRLRQSCSWATVLGRAPKLPCEGEGRANRGTTSPGGLETPCGSPMAPAASRLLCSVSSSCLLSEAGHSALGCLMATCICDFDFARGRR